MVYIPNDDLVKYKQFVPPSFLGDIAYWDGSTVQIVSKTAWNASLGTPIGVVVIPSGMLPDRKCRILSLQAVNSNGNAVSSHSGMKWGPTSTDTPLTTYTKIPITDNNGSTTTGSNLDGLIPSDIFKGEQSFVDSKVFYYEGYNSDRDLIPSPYLGDDNTLNPAYCEVISGYNNALSDFNGLSNTQTLVSLGSDYIAANAAWNYSDGASNLQWYLPAMGELGFMMVRLKEINDTLSMLGGVSVPTYNQFWSSSEGPSNGTHILYIMNGIVNNYSRGNNAYVRPFVAV